MNLEEYKRSGRARYEKLAGITAELLERAITDEGGYRLQQIQPRAKTVESLSRRLEETGQLGTDEIEVHRKDLAGCRIVFYTNNDVRRFVSSGLLRELFDIDWDRSKFHQPGPNQRSASQLFQSDNYVLKLKADRTALLEYREFEGLYCEVQVQTTLNHAWAEMAHDTIYKRPELQGFGAQEWEIIEKRLEEAMRKHLLPAGYLFQRIAIDVQRLTEGKRLFDTGALDAVLAAKDNNERYEALGQLRDHVLPHHDDLQAVFPEIRDKLKEAWLVAGETETVPHAPPFEGFRGIEPHQVTGQIAGIMEQYRYVDLDETYAFIRDLYVQTSNPESRIQLVKLAESLASPTLQIWQRYGPLVQVRLAELLSKEGDIASIAQLVTTISSKILEPDITGKTWSSNAMTLHRGVVLYSDDLEKARRMVVETIAAYAGSVAGDDDALQSAVNSLFDSGRTPQNGAESPELAAMILSDLAHAVECMIGFAPKASFNARQDIESQLLRYWRRNKVLPEHFRSAATVVEAHDRLVKNMIGLREALNADEGFVVFKTIVGYGSVFPHQWDEGGSNFERDQAVRHQRQDELAESITLENWPTWKSRLATAASVKSSDGATFPPYERFLSTIAARQPTLAFELLADRSALPESTIRPIAGVLLNGELREEVEALLEQWLDQGRFVPEIADLAVSAADVDTRLISKIAERAVHDADERACTTLVVGAIGRYAENPEFWRDIIFFPCITVLQQADSHVWIARSWHQPAESSLFANLTADQSGAVLKAMVGLHHIDFPAEEILTSVAATRHQMVLDWFGQRIDVAAREGALNFDFVPFSFESLHWALQPHPRHIITSMREWCGRGDGDRKWDAAHFLSRIYPNFEEPLPSTLLNFVDSADAEDLAFIAFSLRGFDGREELLPVLRAILASDVANDDITGVVSLALHETGVMTGEFGAAETYQAKADLLKPWLDDGSNRVAVFAAREIRHLELMVAQENRRAQEEIAMRKLQYGEPLEADDPGPKNGAD